MKEYKIEGPLIRGNTYLIIDNKIIELDKITRQNIHSVFRIRYMDGSYHKHYEEEINFQDLELFAKVLVCETVDELLDLIPSINNIPNWYNILIRLRNSFIGNLFSGTWVEPGSFKPDDSDTIHAISNAGIRNSFNGQLPFKCDAIIFKRSDYYEICYVYPK
jgi:hypothetical protein